MITSHRARVRAPELSGAGGWINTGGRDLSLADLRGKVVLLDFWTFCCINCLHVLDELRALETRFGDELVVVGVHSPKFVHEADHDALVAAVQRYEVGHPVLDDPALRTWDQYAVRAWPTLVVIDPEGYVVAQAAGEGHGEGLARLIAELVAEHAARGTLRRGAGPYVPPEPEPGELRFPGKVAALPGGTFLVSDSTRHRLVELAADARTVLRRFGTGERGRTDGGPQAACFAEPQGLALLPPEVAARAGYDVVVADTANHALRGLRLADGAVRTVARAPDGVPLSPWDVVWWEGRVAVAAAGTHQLWQFDPGTGALTVLAGTTSEGLRDGPLAEAWFAQPSGLAADGPLLWVADAETSAVRVVSGGQVRTAVGTGLFDFGHRDGPARDALLQHPLGVTVLPDRSVAVLDTYNGAVRRYDPAGEEVTTLAAGLAEPSGAVVAGTGDLVVVESAAHRLTAVPLPGTGTGTGTGSGIGTGVSVPATAHRTNRPATDLAPGPVRLDVVFEPAPGQKLDDREGPATRLTVSASPPELLVDGAGAGTDLSRTLVLSGAVPEGVLHVTAQAASCDADAPFPACHLTRQDWGVPVRLVDGAAGRLPLVLRGLDAPEG